MIIRYLILSGVAVLLYAGIAVADNELVFTSPPRESRAKGQEVYQPIADFLTQATGTKFVYRYPDNWLSYQSEMRKDVYDLVFDGPSFVGWRMAKQQHVPLLKVPGNLMFVVIVRKDNQKITRLKSLAGHIVCGFAPPNLATLTVLYEFDNPVRQPMIVEVKGFRAAYDGVVNKKCVGGMLQARLFEEYNKDAQETRVVFKSAPLPNQALSAGPRIPPVLRDKIIEALLSPAGKVATQKLREEFKGQDLMLAKPEEYQGLGRLMRDVYGFNIDPEPLPLMTPKVGQR